MCDSLVRSTGYTSLVCHYCGFNSSLCRIRILCWRMCQSRNGIWRCCLWGGRTTNTDFRKRWRFTRPSSSCRIFILLACRIRNLSGFDGVSVPFVTNTILSLNDVGMWLQEFFFKPFRIPFLAMRMCGDEVLCSIPYSWRKNLNSALV